MQSQRAREQNQRFIKAERHKDTKTSDDCKSAHYNKGKDSHYATLETNRLFPAIAVGVLVVRISAENPFDLIRNPDSDGDGIPDQIERVLGTDPDDKDTDGDGVEDGVEWWMGSTVSNPLDTPPVPPGTGDSDGDGFADFYEVAKGTDPNDPNSYPLLGDINHNGRIDNIDAVIVFQIALGAIDLTEFVPEVPVMDVDRDTFITYLDAIDIFDFFLGNIDILPTD